MVYGIFNVRKDVNECDCTRGCTDTVRESALKVDSGEKFRHRSGESNLCRQRAGPMLYHLSWITTPPHLPWSCISWYFASFLLHWETSANRTTAIRVLSFFMVVNFLSSFLSFFLPLLSPHNCFFISSILQPSRSRETIFPLFAAGLFKE